MPNNEPDFAKMTDAELAAWQYAHKDELDTDLDTAETVHFTVNLPDPNTGQRPPNKRN